MIKQSLQDKGLRKVLEAEQYHLSSNFVFQTMPKVEEIVRLKEKKKKGLILYSTIAILMFLLLNYGITIIFYLGEKFSVMPSNITLFMSQWDISIWPYCFFLIIFVILMVFDYWMRESYFKNKNNRI